MPEQFSVGEFLEFTKDDVEDPTSSIFTSKLGLCRGTIAILEEVRKKKVIGAHAMIMNRRVWDHGTAATICKREKNIKSIGNSE